MFHKRCTWGRYNFPLCCVDGDVKISIYTKCIIIYLYVWCLGFFFKMYLLTRYACDDLSLFCWRWHRQCTLYCTLFCPALKIPGHMMQLASVLVVHPYYEFLVPALMSSLLQIPWWKLYTYIHYHWMACCIVSGPCDQGHMLKVKGLTRPHVTLSRLNFLSLMIPQWNLLYIWITTRQCLRTTFNSLWIRLQVTIAGQIELYTSVSKILFKYYHLKLTLFIICHCNWPECTLCACRHL